MKLIILEGGDRLGKSTIIKRLCEYYNYDNITIRHFGKPPKGMSPKKVLEFQFKAFKNELNLFYRIYTRSMNNYTYYPEVMIWNRSHLGEYVYSQMFRGGNPEKLKNKLLRFEKKLINYETYLITLTADPDFFNSRESDGHELSKTLEQKTKELELFKEAHKFSILSHKHLIKVDNNGQFRTKDDIFNEVINFIK